MCLTRLLNLACHLFNRVTILANRLALCRPPPGLPSSVKSINRVLQLAVMVSSTLLGIFPVLVRLMNIRPMGFRFLRVLLVSVVPLCCTHHLS